VRARIAQFGEAHPFIRTEYLLEELDGEDGAVPPPPDRADAWAITRGSTRPPPAGATRCWSTWPGEDEHGGRPSAFAASSRRDSTAVTVVEVDEEAAAR
jgi:hypothetical protein